MDFKVPYLLAMREQAPKMFMAMCGRDTLRS